MGAVEDEWSIPRVGDETHQLVVLPASVGDE
jgi:hypothetical protein